MFLETDVEVSISSWIRVWHQQTVLLLSTCQLGRKSYSLSGCCSGPQADEKPIKFYFISLTVSITWLTMHKPFFSFHFFNNRDLLWLCISGLSAQDITNVVAREKETAHFLVLHEITWHELPCVCIKAEKRLAGVSLFKLKYAIIPTWAING